MPAARSRLCSPAGNIGDTNRAGDVDARGQPGRHGDFERDDLAAPSPPAPCGPRWWTRCRNEAAVRAHGDVVTNVATEGVAASRRCDEPRRYDGGREGPRRTPDRLRRGLSRVR